MKNFYTGAIALALAVSCLWTAESQADQTRQSITPLLNLSTLYDSNYFKTSTNEEKVTTFLVQPGIEAAVEDAVETLGYELDIYWEFYQASKNLRELQDMSVCCPITAKDFKKAEAWVEEAYRMVDEWENDL